MIQLLESIKNEVWKAFAFRVYNTFIATVLPVLAGAIILYFNDNQLPIAVTSFLDVELWNYVLGSVVITLLGSAVAGIAKADRVTSGIKEGLSDEG